MKRLHLTASALIALGLVAASGQAQSTGAARGKVLDDKGQPVPEAVVTLEYMGGVTRKFEVKTNKKGEFTQVGLQPGPYRITASKEGLAPATEQARISFGDPTYIREFRLMSRAAAQAAAAGTPSSVEALKTNFRKAADLLQAGKVDEAEAAYKEMLVTYPSVPEIHFNLGLAYAEKKNWPAAQESLAKALELRPEYTEATMELVKALYLGGNTEKAMEVLNQATAANPQDGKLLFSQAVFFINVGKPVEARAVLEKAEALDPSNAEVQYHLGTIFIGANEVAKAIEKLEKYLSMNPQNPQNVATAQALLQALKKK
jgi:tetratricopeptide (TPR) repeat protein